MIVWGGCYDSYTALRTGGRYNPATDGWVATSANAPDVRFWHTAVWTGTEMIVWGGSTAYQAYTYTGGRYDPSGDSWTPTSLDANCPSGRQSHSAVWAGDKMIVWGGTSSPYLNTGGIFFPGYVVLGGPTVCAGQTTPLSISPKFIMSSAR